MEKWKAADVVALAVLSFAFVLLLKGIDGLIGWLLISVATGYLGIKVMSKPKSE